MNESMPVAIPFAVELAAIAPSVHCRCVFVGVFADRRVDVLDAVLVGVRLALGGCLRHDLLFARLDPVFLSLNAAVGRSVC